MKNKNANLFFLVAILCLLSMAACQTAHLAPYTKFENAENVPRITLEEAKKDYDAGTAIIIDSRGDAAYKQDHIAGAINIPFGSPEERFSEIPKGKKIIVYCS